MDYDVLSSNDRIGDAALHLGDLAPIRAAAEAAAEAVAKAGAAGTAGGTAGAAAAEEAAVLDAAAAAASGSYASDGEVFTLPVRRRRRRRRRRRGPGAVGSEGVLPPSLTHCTTAYTHTHCTAACTHSLHRRRRCRGLTETKNRCLPTAPRLRCGTRQREIR